MGNIRHPFYNIIGALFLVCCFTGFFSQAAAIDLFFDPAVSYADSADVFTISLQAADFDSTIGFEIDFAYDNTMVEFVSAHWGALFHDYNPPTGFVWDVEVSESEISVECLITLANSCEPGPGELLELTFQALDRNDVTNLTISDAAVRSCDGTPILPVHTEEASIVIGPMATLFFNPDPKYVLGADHPCRIGMEVDDIDSLRGFQVYLSYDHTKIDFDSALVGDLLTPPTTPPLWWYVTEESDSLVRIEGVLLGPGMFVNGPGELIDLHFHGIVDYDSTELVFDEWYLWDVNTTDFFPVAVDNGWIIIDADLQDVVDDPPAWSENNGLTIISSCGNPGPTPGLVFRTSDAGEITAEIFDVSGRALRRYNLNTLSESVVTLSWDGFDQIGRPVSPGLYYVRINTAAASQLGKVVLIR